MVIPFSDSMQRRIEIYLIRYGGHACELLNQEAGVSHHLTRNTRESCPVAWQRGCVPAWWHILSVGWVSEREHANILPKKAAACLVQVEHVQKTSFRKCPSGN